MFPAPSPGPGGARELDTLSSMTLVDAEVEYGIGVVDRPFEKIQLSDEGLHSALVAVCGHGEVPHVFVDEPEFDQSVIRGTWLAGCEGDRLIDIGDAIIKGRKQ